MHLAKHIGEIVSLEGQRQCANFITPDGFGPAKRRGQHKPDQKDHRLAELRRTGFINNRDNRGQLTRNPVKESAMTISAWT
ncbi:MULTISPECIES: hypothetical protein [unclassified Rhizobium]|uniref:hypothetical protein n=1 Tax=unclassified Rhizobium TaxID=2613769 RepID=UPI001FD94989|nr:MULTISPECIES: hypothetical protein [unclassified Rhizobium]